MREQAGLTIDQVARVLRCSQSKISRIETGRIAASPQDIRSIVDIYGIGGRQLDALLQIAQEAQRKGWWQTSDDRALRSLIGYETAATSIRTFGIVLIPGLLQTKEYARAVISAVYPDLPSDEVEDRVQLRIARQEHIIRMDPPALWAIIDEAAIRRPVGGAKAMREQLSHLMEVAGLPAITLQVLPFSTEEHAGLDGAFTIHSFSELAIPDVVWLESASSDRYLDGNREVRRYTAIFDHLRAAALKPNDSAAFLARLIREP